MELIIEATRYRHKQDRDLVITVLDLGACDEDYKERAFIYEYENLDMGWQVSLNHHFLDDFELMEEE
ncbi:MAG: hypothetical protein ROM03_02045 [Mucispirillum sp.]|nr:hypothetical protein [Mucispirillum sp.]